jgi:hypothetical protein
VTFHKLFLSKNRTRTLPFIREIQIAFFSSLASDCECVNRLNFGKANVCSTVLTCSHILSSLAFISTREKAGKIRTMELHNI